MFWMGVYVGIVVGFIMGIIVISMCVVAKRNTPTAG
jgi:uncharacterized membrane-anchored protein YhcB (DUF1043 family)